MYHPGIGFRLAPLPDFSTLCVRKQLLKLPIWRDFLRLSTTLHELDDIQAIGASGIDRIGASQHKATKTKYTFKAVKTTLVVDCKTGTILDIHCSMKQARDSEVGWQLLRNNLDRLDTVTADEGYDWELLRRKLQAEGVTPVIKYREFDWQGTAHNALIDDQTYHQRSNVESTFFALRQRYGSRLQARTWFGQFREMVLRCAVRDVELAVKRSEPVISSG